MLSGCVQSSSPSPSPTVVATAVPTATATATATATPTPLPSATEEPVQELSELRDGVGGVLESVFGKPFAFTEDKDPASGRISYFTGGESDYFNIRVDVKPSTFTKWPPDKTLVEFERAGGSKEKMAFVQSGSQQPSIRTEFEMECNGFRHLITVVLTEQNTGSLPFQDKASELVSGLLEACA
ncbi:MAG: hypothetical protein QXR53_02380 [Candidatus Norongarragalinales archaeon]